MHYESAWRDIIHAFDCDRSVCRSSSMHDCLGYLLWGEVYYWPSDEINRRYQTYRLRSSVFLEPLVISSDEYSAELYMSAQNDIWRQRDSRTIPEGNSTLSSPASSTSCLQTDSIGPNLTEDQYYSTTLTPDIVPSLEKTNLNQLHPVVGFKANLDQYFVSWESMNSIFSLSTTKTLPILQTKK